MPAVPKKLYGEAMKLPARSRARLAERLIASLDEGPDDSDAEEAWMEEAQRRAAEIAGGKVAGIQAEKVMKRARTALR